MTLCQEKQACPHFANGNDKNASHKRFQDNHTSHHDLKD